MKHQTMKNEHPGSRCFWRWGFILSLLSGGVPMGAQPASCYLRWHQISTNSPFGNFHDWYLRYHAFAYDSGRHVPVVFGGLLVDPRGQNVPFESGTWEWNGAAWEERCSIVEPSPREDPAMAYDGARRVCVLFGGHHENTDYNDTYEWDGVRWAFRQAFDPTATNRPPPMRTPLMAYDSARKRTVLIGKESGRTWEWDGTNWMVQPTAPSPRRNAAMAYDRARRIIVLFGGKSTDAPYDFLGDTLTWDGTNWTQVATGGPRPRIGHTMSYDIRRKVIVLLGGRGSDSFPNAFDDTWEWDGQSWVKPFAGLVRDGPTMWYDEVEQKLILFSGRQPDSDGWQQSNDVWEARPPGNWVDFNAPGLPSVPETGSFYEPFNTLIEAISSVPLGCTLNLKAGSSPEVVTISKPLTLDAYYGPVTIGQP
jgi:hypothetical protein